MFRSADRLAKTLQFLSSTGRCHSASQIYYRKFSRLCWHKNIVSSTQPQAAIYSVSYKEPTSSFCISQKYSAGGGRVLLARNLSSNSDDHTAKREENFLLYPHDELHRSTGQIDKTERKKKSTKKSESHNGPNKKNSEAGLSLLDNSKETTATAVDESSKKTLIDEADVFGTLSNVTTNVSYDKDEIDEERLTIIPPIQQMELRNEYSKKIDSLLAERKVSICYQSFFCMKSKCINSCIFFRCLIFH